MEYAAAQQLQYALYAIYAKVDVWLLLGLLNAKEARKWFSLRRSRPRYAFKHLSNMHYSEGLEQLLVVKAFLHELMSVSGGKQFEVRDKGEFLTVNERGSAFLADCANTASTTAGFWSAADQAGDDVLVQEMEELRQMADMGEITLTEYEDRSEATLSRAETRRLLKSQESEPTGSLRDDGHDCAPMEVGPGTLF